MAVAASAGVYIFVQWMFTPGVAIKTASARLDTSALAPPEPPAPVPVPVPAPAPVATLPTAP